MTTRLPLRDRLRIEAYLAKFAWPMQDYPHREYKQIKAELRASLRTAAADVGTKRAIADLGSPFALADQYRENLGRKLPRWTAGGVAAALTVGALVYLAMAYVLGSLSTLEATGASEAEIWLYGSPMRVVHSEDLIGVESTVSWASLSIYAGAGAIAFLLASRFWRAFGG